MTEIKIPSKRYTLFSDKREEVSHIVWHAATGYWPRLPEMIHHIDENPSNNELSNLRLMTISEHISLHHTGKIYTEESKAKMSAAKTGTTHSEKTKAKMSASHLGKYTGESSWNWKGDAAKPQSKYMREWRARRRENK